MMKCCDNPVFAGPCPNAEGDTTALCGNCGHKHGVMKLDKAEALFKKLRSKAGE
jgi:hypothetical protein